MSYEGHTATLPLVIVGGKCPTLLGRDWLEELRLGWSRIKAVSSNDLQAKLRNYDDVFQPGLGNYKGFQARIDVDPEANPRFYKARTVPYAMRLMVDKELDRLVQAVEHSDWAAPIVAVLKPDRKNVRICGDFRQSSGQAGPICNTPKREDFSKLDLSQAYQQLSQSKKYVVINTRKGLFRYTRLPYGISSAPGIFQRVMETLLKDIPRVTDDILITEAGDNWTSLEQVVDLWAPSQEKCIFMASYLGSMQRGKAIQEVPTPKNVSEDSISTQPTLQIIEFEG